MDEIARDATIIRDDAPLPADLEDLEGDGPQDAESVVAHVVAPEPPAVDAPLDEYDVGDIAADTDSTPEEIDAAIKAARSDAGRSGPDRRYPQRGD
jgi:hypothetical protein